MASPSGQAPPRGGWGYGFRRLFAGSLLGKLLGAVRELALAAGFGTGVPAGALRAGQTTTLLPTQGLILSLVDSGFLPLCSRYAGEEEERVSGLFWTTLVLVALIACGVGALLWGGADLWAALIVPGFGPEAREATAAMIATMALSVPLIGIARVLSALEMAHGGYAIGSARSVAENLGVISAIALAAWTGRPALLAWGFVVYGTLYLLAGGLVTLRRRILPPVRALRVGEMASVAKELVRLARVLWLLPLASQGVLVAERIFASLISVGAVASLGYAKAISETGIALVAIPLGLVGLAELSRLSVREARERLDAVLPRLLICLVPCSMFLALHTGLIVDTLFARGQFGPDSIRVTTLILFGLSLGLWAEVPGYVLLKGLHAQSANWAAVGYSTLSGLVYLATTSLLFRPLGPMALGLGMSAYGLSLLLLGAAHFGLLKRTAGVLLLLLPGAVIYGALGRALDGFGGAEAVAAIALFVVFWPTYFASVRPLRAMLTPVVRSLVHPRRSSSSTREAAALGAPPLLRSSKLANSTPE